MSIKICQACHAAKDSSEFHAAPRCVGGRDTTCKACKVASARARRASRVGLPPAAHQICRACKTQKPGAEFRRNVLNSSGLAGQCRSCAFEAERAYRAANAASLSAANKAWRANNAGYMTACNRARYAADPARFKEYANDWRRSNPEAYKAIKHRQRARRRGAVVRLTLAAWREIVAQFNSACAYCLRPIDAPTIDHMVPLCRGGEHTAENVVPACSFCNTSKGARSIFTMLPRCGVAA